MAIVERPTAPLELTTGQTAGGRPLGAFTRPQSTRGWTSWLTTVDHKRIGILYLIVVSLAFALGLVVVSLQLRFSAPRGDEGLIGTDEIFTQLAQHLLSHDLRILGFVQRVVGVSGDHLPDTNQ